MTAQRRTIDILDILELGAKVALKDEGKQYRYAELGLFTESEAHPLDELVTLVERYLALESPPRPLSIAIFGAPGSGKSRLAKELPKLLSHGGPSELAPLVEINLTQIASTDELAAALAGAAAGSGKPAPFVFFDEFDSKQRAAPWGWLSWFLAPMQDGAFRSAGATVLMRRAVLAFAGGTAPAFKRFGTSDPPAFVAAKGPDFVSRLRGYIDIPGINAGSVRESPASTPDPIRDFRRASVLGYQIRRQGKIVTPELRDALLYAGRYKHGARSMEAIVELIPASKRVTVDDLRKNALVKMHVDRGPLDPDLIGGCIGLSAGGDKSNSPRADAFGSSLTDVWHAVSRTLFKDGARLAYGGHAMEDGLAAQLKKVVRGLPQHLVGDGVWIVTAPDQKTPEPAKGAPPPEEKAPSPADVQRLPRPPVEPHEVPSHLSDDQKTQWRNALGWFRTRHLLSLRSVAQFAIGGRLGSLIGATRRFPGVAEELMIALAMGHPVYIAGGLGGGAEWAGVLLGLGRHWRGPLPGFDAFPFEIPAGSEALFRPPPFTDLPLTRDELISFFERHALGGERWPDNGLDPEQNRELFECSCTERITALVIHGLRTRFGGGDSRPQPIEMFHHSEGCRSASVSFDE